MNTNFKKKAMTLFYLKLHNLHTVACTLKRKTQNMHDIFNTEQVKRLNDW